MSRQHTDKEYEAELRSLREQLLLAGARVEEGLAGALQALVQRDSGLAHHLIDSDREIDALEVAIDEHCLRILAKRQPVASDLRFLTTSLKIVTDLERVGDLVVNICERAIELNAEPQLKPYIDLPRMGETVQSMLREALDAFVGQDVERARSVLERDHQVDAYYGQVFRELLTYMLEDPRNIQRAIKLQSIAKYLERIGDHATNLAEMVVFLARGKDIRHRGGLRTSTARPHGVLFLGVYNAVESQLAEAWARRLFPVGVRIWSAGIEPAARIDAEVVATMQEAGIDMSAARPKGLSEIPLGDIDTVIALCPQDRAPQPFRDLVQECWTLSLPAGSPQDQHERIKSLRTLREELRRRTEELLRRWSEE